MIWLRLFGQTDLSRDDASDIDALLRQPKHFALLAYLALPAPGTWHRREVILSTFWPESDQSRARSSLRSALYTLRGHLPEGVVRTRGDDEVSLDPDIIDTDAASMVEDFESNRFADALNKYQGELLAGIFVAESPEFESWLEAERSRYLSVARKSASELSRERESHGDIAGAVDAARQAYELDPNDEAGARRWIALLDRAGDRAQAFAIYERFRNHMSEHFGVRPSAETVALMDAIRTRHQTNGSNIEPVILQSSHRHRTSRRWLFALAPVAIAVTAFILLTPGLKPADVSRSLFRKPIPPTTRAIDQSIDPESYKLMLKGRHLMLANPNNAKDDDAYAARDAFAKALDIDPLNARAWSGLSSVWASLALSAAIPLKEGTERAEAEALRAIAIDSLQGSAWANLGVARAMHDDDLTIGLKLIGKAIRVDPANPEIYLIKSNLLRSAHRYDEARDAIRVARRLDPLSLLYLNHNASIEFCADRPEYALAIFEDERRMNPGNPTAVNGTIRSLALLGRFDEAISLWRNSARTIGDTAVVRSLADAHGATGYWAIKHAEGRRNLSKLSPDATPRNVILARFAAGDEEGAYRAIDETPATERASLYRLGCYAGVDEYRRTSRFKAVIERIGYMKAH